MRLAVKLISLCVVSCAIAELILLYSLGLLDYSDRVQAQVTNVSIKPVPVLMERDARAVQASVRYTYKNVSYSAHVEERLHSLSYESLEDSNLYLTLLAAMKNGSTIGVAIYPRKPELPRLVPDLALIRLYAYLTSILAGIFITFSTKSDSIHKSV